MERAEDLNTNDTTEGVQVETSDGAAAAPSAAPASEAEKLERKNPLGYTLTEETQEAFEKTETKKGRS